jgi:dTDP-4-dehydrorhamnose 3,5-epimerase
MIFIGTQLPGAFLIEPERIADERGFFARTWCQKELASRGLESHLAQCSISYNPKKGTLRGMHFQTAPREEVKIVRCTRGEIYDVIIDLRPGSYTFKKWFGVILSEEKRNMIYIPKGFAHGFLTLSDQVEIFYQMSEFYSPDHARGVRWNDPAFDIRWPVAVQLISDRDNHYPDFESNR